MRGLPISRIALLSLAPLYVTACVLFGGASREGLVVQAGLAAIAALGLTFIFASRALDWLYGPVRTVYFFIGALIVLILMQLIPLPPGVWSGLTDRDVVISGYEALGIAAPNLPLSFTPGETFRSLTQFLPPIFIFTLLSILPRADGVRLVKWTIPVLACVSALLGGVQLATGNQSAFYLYEITNRGFGVGIFSNANHQATLMLMGLPFVALIAASRVRNISASDADIGLVLMIGIMSLLMVAGVIGAGSMAGYGMLVPVILGGAFVYRSHRRRRRRGSSSAGMSINPMMGWAAVAAVVVATIGLVLITPQLDALGLTKAGDGDLSRLGILETAKSVLRNHFVLGTGLGGFDEVFKLYENPDSVTGTFANHAHNDYLQWLIEMGLPGILLLATFVAWWAKTAFSIWLSPQQSDSSTRKAATIATMVVFLHSFVDYPLRTPAISVLAAACLAMMIIPSSPYENQTQRRSQQIDL